MSGTTTNTFVWSGRWNVKSVSESKISYWKQSTENLSAIPDVGISIVDSIKYDRERRKRDSNPRYGSPYSGFQGQIEQGHHPTPTSKPKNQRDFERWSLV